MPCQFRRRSEGISPVVRPFGLCSRVLASRNGGVAGRAGQETPLRLSSLDRRLLQRCRGGHTRRASGTHDSRLRMPGFLRAKLDFQTEVCLEKIVDSMHEPHQLHPSVCDSRSARVLYTRRHHVPITIIRLESTQHGVDAPMKSRRSWSSSRNCSKSTDPTSCSRTVAIPPRRG